MTDENDENDEGPAQLIRGEGVPPNIEALMGSMSRHISKPEPLPRSLRRKTKFTPAVRDRYLSVLARFGLKGVAARVCNVSPGAINEYAKTDPMFMEELDEAMDLYRDSISIEVQRRAVEGYLEPVIGGKDRNIVVTYVRKYSDRLLELHAKRYIPEYRDKISVDATIQTGVLAVTGSSLTEEEYQKKYERVVAPTLEGEYRLLKDE